MADKTLELEITGNVGEVAEQTEQLADATKDAQGGFTKIGGAIKGMGTALKAAGIGLVVALFAKLMDVFRQNQSVVDFFNVAMESLSLAFNDLFKFLSNNIGAVTGYFKSIFEDPKQSILDFGQAIKENLIERFDSLLDTFGHLGKALGHLFKGEFSEAFDSVKDAGKESIDIITGVDNSVDKITETATNASKAFKEYAKSTIETATTMVELRKESELAAVKVQGLIEDYDRQAEKLRQVRDDETKTFEERIAANEELGRVLKEQEEEMLKLIDIRIKEAELDVAKNNSIENQVKLQEALNEKKAVEAQITGFQSEQLVNQVSLQKEQAQLAIENADAQLQAYSDLASALSSLAGENKQLAVASAIIDTFAGANKALREGAGTPLGFIQAAAIIAAGLANVKKIMSVDVGTGGGGAVPSDTGTPAPEMLSGAFTLGGGQEQQPVQAYVVTDDMTNNQNKLANIRRRATI
jgi:hypothetical protein